MSEGNRQPLRVSRRAAGLQPSATLQVSAEAARLRGEGRDVLAFGAGEPDFPTPDHVLSAAKRALDEGATRYTPAAGMPPLRAAVAEWTNTRHGTDYAAEDAVVTSGAKQALFNAIQVVADPGDRVVVPAPYWVSYVEQVRAAQAEAVVVDCPADRGFLPDPAAMERAVDGAAAVLINSPSNPTGAVWPAELLEQVATAAVRAGCTVISDEIYSEMTYPDAPDFRCVASLSDEIAAGTLTVNGVSKAWSMTGWRLGWILGPPQWITPLARLQAHSTGNAAAVSQHAALAALTGPQDCVGRMRDAFDGRRRTMVEGLRALPEVTCPEPGGAFYCFPDVSAHYGRTLAGVEVTDSLTFCTAALQGAEVALVPGGAFGADAHVRLSYAASEETIREGLRRLGDLLG